MSTPSGFIKDKVNEIFNVFVVDKSGELSSNVTNYSNLMLPGQKRKCVYNEKAKLAKNNTISISYCAPENTVKIVDDGGSSITIEALNPSAFEAVVVRAVEKDVNGKICRAFEKKFTIFQFGPISTGTIAQAGDDGIVDITLHPANLVPSGLTVNATVLVQIGANCVLYNNKGEQLLPTENHQAVSGIRYEIILWDEYVTKFLDPGNPSGKCKLQVNKGSTGYLKMAFFPFGELGGHLTSNSEGLPLYMVVFPVDNLYVPVGENVEIPVTAYLVTGDGSEWDSPDVTASVAWSPLSLSSHPVPGGIPSETPVTKNGYSEILFPVVNNFASGNPTYQVNAEITNYTVSGKPIDIGTVSASSGAIQFIPGEPAKVEFNNTNIYLRADGNHTATVSVTVYDQFNNPVFLPAKTTFSIDGDADIISADEQTTNGVASVTIQGGITPGSITLNVEAGNAHENVEINLHPIIITISQVPTLDISNSGNSVTVTADVRDDLGQACDGATVYWIATKGKLDRANSTVASDGSTQVTLGPDFVRLGFDAQNRIQPSTGVIRAAIGDQIGRVNTGFEWNANAKLVVRVENPMLAVDGTDERNFTAVRVDVPTTITLIDNLSPVGSGRGDVITQGKYCTKTKVRVWGILNDVIQLSGIGMCVFKEGEVPPDWSICPIAAIIPSSSPSSSSIRLNDNGDGWGYCEFYVGAASQLGTIYMNDPGKLYQSTLTFTSTAVPSDIVIQHFSVAPHKAVAVMQSAVVAALTGESEGAAGDVTNFLIGWAPFFPDIRDITIETGKKLTGQGVDNFKVQLSMLGLSIDVGVASYVLNGFIVKVKSIYRKIERLKNNSLLRKYLKEMYDQVQKNIKNGEISQAESYVRDNIVFLDDLDKVADIEMFESLIGAGNRRRFDNLKNAVYKLKPIRANFNLMTKIEQLARSHGEEIAIKFVTTQHP